MFGAHRIEVSSKNVSSYSQYTPEVKVTRKSVVARKSCTISTAFVVYANVSESRYCTN